MANKLDDMKLRLGDLSTERAQLDLAIEDLIAAMGKLPPEQRSTGDWGPGGVSTQTYLKLSKRQAAVEAEIIDLNRAIAETGGPASSLH